MDYGLEVAKISIPALTAGLMVYWTYWLTTRKEKRVAAEKTRRAYAAEKNMVNNLKVMVVDGKSHDGNPLIYYRDLLSRVKGLCEYAGLATKDVYEFADFRMVSQFMELKRIAYHYRDGIEDSFSDGKVYNNESLRNDMALRVQKLAHHIDERIRAYFVHYGINPHTAYAPTKETDCLKKDERDKKRVTERALEL